MDDAHGVRDVATTDVVFLGAGFSRGATGGASPVMSDFFTRLDRRKYWELWSFLEQLIGNPKQANVEQTLLTLDQLAISPLDGVEPFFDEVRKRHQRVRSELDSYMLEILGKMEIPDDNWPADLLFRAASTTTVITTNYDNLAERILSHQKGLRHRTKNTNCHHCKLCAILSDECRCDGDLSLEEAWKGSLLKLHGSISWRRCMNADCSTQQCLLPDKHCRPFSNEKCATCGGPCSPVLVPPSMVKTFDKFRGLKQVWSAAYRALTEASSILFWGFSFPTSDVLISQMLRSAITTRPRKIDIGIIDVDPDRPAAMLHELIGGANEHISVHSYPVPRDGAVPDWLVDDAGASSPVTQAQAVIR
jgi:NAD-dependent SIR2 family protein deacetylase